ncbi:uncharacterized protein LOC106672710 isoform X2 [Cimex lectularius]|uniref:Uncharacterized protein n=1 Tax=Cimex lectularius TaxID=79782 RepID=A0A8I6SFB9_CIMLE|nr:uncharacterized protein LOC106672710 isoform X2 [Cimex lectularius]
MQKVLQLASVCCPCCAAKSSDNEVDVGSNFEYVVHNHYIYKVRKPATTVRTGIPEEFKIGDTISNHSSPTYRRDKKKSERRRSRIYPEGSLAEGFDERNVTGIDQIKNINSEGVQVYFVENNETSAPLKSYNAHSPLSAISKHLYSDIAGDSSLLYSREETATGESKKENSTYSLSLSQEETLTGKYVDLSSSSSIPASHCGRARAEKSVQKSRTFKEAMELPEMKKPRQNPGGNGGHGY